MATFHSWDWQVHVDFLATLWKLAHESEGEGSVSQLEAREREEKEEGDIWEFVLPRSHEKIGDWKKFLVDGELSAGWGGGEESHSCWRRFFSGLRSRRNSKLSRCCAEARGSRRRKKQRKNCCPVLLFPTFLLLFLFWRKKTKTTRVRRWRKTDIRYEKEKKKSASFSDLYVVGEFALSHTQHWISHISFFFLEMGASM